MIVGFFLQYQTILFETKIWIYFNSSHRKIDEKYLMELYGEFIYFGWQHYSWHQCPNADEISKPLLPNPDQWSSFIFIEDI